MAAGCSYVHVGNGGKVVHEQAVRVFDQSTLDRLERLEAKIDERLLDFQGRVSTVHEIVTELTTAASIDVEDVLRVIVALEGAASAAEAAQALLDSSTSPTTGSANDADAADPAPADDSGDAKDEEAQAAKSLLAEARARIDALRKLLVNEGKSLSPQFREKFPSLVENPQRILSTFSDVHDAFRREKMRLLSDVTEFGPKGDRRRYFFRVPLFVTPHLTGWTKEDVTAIVEIRLSARCGSNASIRDIVIHEVTPRSIVNRRQADAASRSQTAIATELATTFRNSNAGTGFTGLENFATDIALIDREKAAIAYVGIDDAGHPYFGYRIPAITQLKSRFLLSPALLLSYLTSSPEYRTTPYQGIDPEGFLCDVLISVPKQAFEQFETGELELELASKTHFDSEGAGTLIAGFIPFLNIRGSLASVMSAFQTQRAIVRLSPPTDPSEEEDCEFGSAFPRKEPLAIIESPRVSELVVVPGIELHGDDVYLGYFGAAQPAPSKTEDSSAPPQESMPVRLDIEALAQGGTCSKSARIRRDLAFWAPPLPKELETLDNRTHRLNVVLMRGDRAIHIGHILYHAAPLPEPKVSDAKTPAPTPTPLTSLKKAAKEFAAAAADATTELTSAKFPGSADFKKALEGFTKAIQSVIELDPKAKSDDRTALLQTLEDKTNGARAEIYSGLKFARAELGPDVPVVNKLEALAKLDPILELARGILVPKDSEKKEP